MTKSLPISAIVLLKNDTGVLDKSLASLSFCREIIIVLDENADTEAIATSKQHGAHIFTRPLQGDFAAQRNYAATISQFDWLLHLDADEVLSPALIDEIKKCFTKVPQETAFYLRRHDIFWNRVVRYGELADVAQFGICRLVNRRFGHWEGSVHESWFGRGDTACLDNQIFHYAHADLTSFLRKINFYTDLKAQELSILGKRFSILEAIVWPVGKFFYTFFIRFGFLDRESGFVYSFMMSFHSFLVRAKLFQKTRLAK